MTDIRFEGDFIHLEGLVVRATANDLMLDASARRTTGTPFRRALVHDFDDGLTLNWDHDYPGGVSINGCKQILGFNNRDWLIVRSRIHQQFGTDFMLDGGAERRGRVISRLRRNPFRRALVHGFGDQLVVNWDHDYTGGVVVNGRVTMPDGVVVAGQDVAATLTSLTSRVTELSTELTATTAAIADLTTRLAALETEPTP
ncbi:hypothetical protein H9L21_01765 [Aeromicrobium senzhongii]|uniref:Peptidase S74 domain-containing protein n=1 Tax=Aeromicrobium senzhongii TaxID=2663859 RepID=A0ABX6SVF8_9ACTN|nr:hypothetical protein [Aeromicrobium senzhongii]MTB88302.1 hypothetical protein [Aeromicrobium senzhongii]QNL94720.1 hypothetical protein H9L21_01765 [Aeromicrobium senzhongii]